MLLRGIIYGIDHRITINWLNPGSNWFSINNRSYRIDRKAVSQVVEKGGALKGIVELLYIEGNPVPIGSSLKNVDLIMEHFEEKISKSTNEPKTPGFFSKLTGS